MIFITGATGFVGSHLVRRLYQEGYRMRCLVRDTRQANHIRSQDIAPGDMREPKSLIKATKGCNAVIHLAAPIGYDDYKTNYDVTVQGAKNLIEACKQNNVKRIIFLSSVMALIGQSNYGKTKRMAEHLFLMSGLNVTILRGDWIYGKGDWGLSKLLKLIKKYPFIPIPGNGNYMKRPIYVDDAVKAIIKCLRSKNAINKTYMLGGPSITYDDMLETFCKAAGIDKRKVHLPMAIFFFAAAVAKLFGSRVITKNNVLGLTFDSNYNIRKTKELVNPIGFKKGLAKCKDYYQPILRG